MSSKINNIFQQLTIPTYITLARLCVAPLVLPVLFVLLLPFNNIVINGFVSILFMIFGLTDFIDGFVARRYSQESELGKVLDPIADKFLFYSCFIGLLAAGKVFFLWAIIFIGRDFFVMGLRQIALQYAYDVKVSSLGKLRTAVLMGYISVVILNPYQYLALREAPWWYALENILLLASLVLTVWSGHNYFVGFIQEFNQRFDQRIHE